MQSFYLWLKLLCLLCGAFFLLGLTEIQVYKTFDMEKALTLAKSHQVLNKQMLKDLGTTTHFSIGLR
ncbi:MAG: hypothetical protein KC643_32895 [Nitrospira sp.]|nr:hypothetical protein [Nitrospira sp.]